MVRGLPYRDRFTRIPPAGLFPALRSVLHELGQEVDPLFEEGGGHEWGQIYLENMVLLPLRKAVMRGEIIETAKGYEKSPRGAICAKT